MVCISAKGSVQNNELKCGNSESVKMSQFADENENSSDNLKLKRIAGGSVITYPPLFSDDGEILFIIWENVVREFSTVTGEWLRDLDGLEDPIVALEFDLFNPKLLWACTSTGAVVSWKWKSCVVHEKHQLPLNNKKATVSTFNLLDIDGHSTNAIVTWKSPNVDFVQWSIMNVANGSLHDLNIDLQLKNNAVIVATSPQFPLFAIAQRGNLFVVNFKTKAFKKWRNIRKKQITCLAFHPHEEMIITGDELGRALLWRSLLENCDPMTTLYHWHHTRVNTIAFTESGTYFYSGGDESVLVRWSIHDSQNKSFLPRMAGTIQHVCVSKGNHKAAFATNDNGIQIVNAQNRITAVIQNFTWIADDKTHQERFPIGLKVNPRTSNLVLNGRVGHLQFFSTYTRSLLYNLDTAIQNRLSLEQDKVLYNTRITHTAVNMDWLVTAELLDDHEHSPEVRLKFWQYEVAKQTYSLNTHIELPHEGGITALEFSSANSSDNLVCASTGNDNYLKIWSLEDSENIYKPGTKMWACIGRVFYKGLPIESIAFSQDSSLLAAGFGDSLCIYSTDTLKLRCALNAPSGFDGSACRVRVHLPKRVTSRTPKKDHYKDNVAKRKRMLELIKLFLENKDKSLLKSLQADDKKSSKAKHITTSDITDKEKHQIFKEVMSMKELNLHQKIVLFQNLDINCKAVSDVEERLCDYFASNLSIVSNMEGKLKEMLPKVDANDRYKACWKYKIIKRRSIKKLKSILLDKVVTVDEVDDLASKPNGTKHHNGINKDITSDSEDGDDLLPVFFPSKVKHIAFGTGDFSHLVVVAMEHRLMVWNLLTLRLQASLKLSVHKLVVDPFTSVVAAFTIFNELYVFLPNAPIPLYHRRGIPSVFGCAWVPRRYPKSSSVTIDWQATSQLFFLSAKQELLYLSASAEDDEVMSAASLGDLQKVNSFTPFGAMIAKQVQNATAKSTANNSLSIGVPGKSSVQELVNYCTHTMVPARMLCSSFIQSLLITNKTKTKAINGNDDGTRDYDMDAIDELDDDAVTSEDVDMEIAKRRKFISNMELQNGADYGANEIQIEKQLERLLNEQINF